MERITIKNGKMHRVKYNSEAGYLKTMAFLTAGYQPVKKTKVARSFESDEYYKQRAEEKKLRKAAKKAKINENR